MKYYSELTKKLYGTEKDLLLAEDQMRKAAVQKLEAEKREAAEKAKKAERAARAKEVEKAMKELTDAQANAIKLLKQFTKDYGYFHMSLSPDTETDKVSTKEVADEFLNLLNSFLK